MREDNTTIEIRKASALPENNNLRQVTQLKLLNRLKAAGANVNVRSPFSQSLTGKNEMQFDGRLLQTGRHDGFQ